MALGLSELVNFIISEVRNSGKAISKASFPGGLAAILTPFYSSQVIIKVLEDANRGSVISELRKEMEEYCTQMSTHF